MALDTLRRAFILLIFGLAQALLFNRIQLFNCATPLLYVYFVIMFPRNYPKWALLLWSFALGLIVDMFANTPGMATASLTAVGALQPYMLELLLPRDPEENHESSVYALGWGRFFMLSLTLSLFHCLLFFTIELFTFFDWTHWLLCIVSSTVLTMMLIMAFEAYRSHRPSEPLTQTLS